MKGYLLISVARSGTYWLCDLANRTGQMGVANEWLKPKFLGIRPSDYSPASYMDLVVKKASSNNGRFGVKIFPHHLQWVQDYYGFDFIAECQKRHDVKIIFLERRDRMRQAISLARSKMTAQWKSTSAKKSDEHYDFDAISRARFGLEEGYAFWRAYLGLRNVNPVGFVYEDLLQDPTPWLRTLASHLQVEAPSDMTSELKIQRDAVTEEWTERYRADVSKGNVLESTRLDKSVKRTATNLIRFVRKQPLLTSRM